MCQSLQRQSLSLRTDAYFKYNQGIDMLMPTYFNPSPVPGIFAQQNALFRRGTARWVRREVRIMRFNYPDDVDGKQALLWCLETI